MLIFLIPRQLPAFMLAIYWAAVIYSFYCGLIGVLVRNELGGIIAVLFLANIDVGYLEIPGYSTVLDEWFAVLLPGFFPTQLAIDAAFTSRLEKPWPSLWSIPHAGVVAGFMLLGYQRATHIHTFLPEQRGRGRWRIAAAIVAAVLVLAGGAYARDYYQAQPRTVEADGRISAPEARVIAPVTGRIRDLRIALGDRVAEDASVALIEDQVTQATVPLRAPVSGTVTRVDVREGENLIQGGVMAGIHRLDQLEVVLEVEETQVASVAVGQQVQLKFASLGESVTAVVTEIAQEPLPPELGVTESTKRVRKYAVKVPLPRPDERLRLGMAVRGKIIV
ncbi:MAG: HlyD family efflux transporter periplasmic adaptor subunit [Dehalococcoidia bacterium]|nr:HlyD family efflux transporter periplasmic adaptor subunit [Dehalococcoidia bacterium]